MQRSLQRATITKGKQTNMSNYVNKAKQKNLIRPLKVISHKNVKTGLSSYYLHCLASINLVAIV
jgi:hypothetical protein